MWHSYGSHAPTSIRYLAQKWWRDTAWWRSTLQTIEISWTISNSPIYHPYSIRTFHDLPIESQGAKARAMAAPKPRRKKARPSRCRPWRMTYSGVRSWRRPGDGPGWPGDGLGSFEGFWCFRDFFCWVLGLLGVLKWFFGWFLVSLLDLLCVFVSLMVWRFSGTWAAHIHWFYMIWLMISLMCWWVYPAYPSIACESKSDFLVGKWCTHLLR